MKVFVVICMLVVAAYAAPNMIDNQVHSESSMQESFFKVLSNCADTGDMTSCLTVKGITALNRAARSQSIELIPGITFERDATVSARIGKAVSENEIFETLPVDKKEKNGRLLDLAMDAAGNFLASQKLQFKLPTETVAQVARALSGDRAIKAKVAKLLSMVAVGVVLKMLVLFKFVVLPIALLALFLSKIALVVGVLKPLGVGLFSRLANSAGSNGIQTAAAPLTSYNTGAGYPTAGSYPYARSYDLQNESSYVAQDLAYSGQAPSQQ